MIPSVRKKIQLRLSTHHGNVFANFEAYRKSGRLVDVTLSAEGQFIKAHKILLSACSSYFEDLFTQMDSEKYPIVYLNDVKFSELEALIHFMYHGEVKIWQEDLPSLLEVAKKLRIRGLSSEEPPPPPSKYTPPLALRQGEPTTPLSRDANDLTTSPSPDLHCGSSGQFTKNSKCSPPLALMASEPTTTLSQAVTDCTTSSSHKGSSGQFTNNLAAETPIRIVSCNSLATISPDGFPSHSITPSLLQYPLNHKSRSILANIK